ncbi:hypothetical protein DKX38_004587 [Salix brachista]|uniref:Uncharacterized protein n=1 Tax=Salix brachista TaxID=2182728 RepID=A0A5N5ND43_9ROSI|nr:hypothetical protein DKX38_004587 [Salix brachista]
MVYATAFADGKKSFKSGDFAAPPMDNTTPQQCISALLSSLLLQYGGMPNESRPGLQWIDFWWLLLLRCPSSEGACLIIWLQTGYRLQVASFLHLLLYRLLDLD